MGAQAFMVAANGANKDIAQEFVNNGVNSEEAMQTLFDETQLLPAMTSVQETVADPDLTVFTAAANAATRCPQSRRWRRSGSRSARPTRPSSAARTPTSTIKAAGETINKAIEDAGLDPRPATSRIADQVRRFPPAAPVRLPPARKPT